jgi:flagellar biosynthesis protein FliR
MSRRTLAGLLTAEAFVSTRAVPVAVDAAFAFACCCFVMNGLSTTSNELTPGGYRPKIREQCKQ